MKGVHGDSCGEKHLTRRVQSRIGNKGRMEACWRPRRLSNTFKIVSFKRIGSVKLNIIFRHGMEPVAEGGIVDEAGIHMHNAPKN